MRSNESKDLISSFASRLLEGRLSTLQFIVLIGSFSTLILLYISLQICFFNVSKELAREGKRADALMEHNVKLTARYNKMVSPERILPIAERYGLKPATSKNLKRIAVFEERTSRISSWAEAAIDKVIEVPPLPRSEGAL